MHKSLYKGLLAWLFANIHFPQFDVHTSIFGSLDLAKILEVLFFLNRKFGEYLCKMPPKKGSKRRGSQETERMSTRARSPEVDELSSVPETQQVAGVEELVVAVEDPLEMSDAEQGDIGLETQHESDTSDEDT